MDFRYTTEQELFRDTLRKFCAENIEPISREIDEKEDGIPDEIIQGLAAQGVFGLTIPEQYGGTAPEGERDGGHITLVRTDPEAGHKGFTFVFIPAGLPGVTYTTFDDMGRMALSTGGFTYQDVEVPEYCILGEPNRGFYINMEGFNLARILVASACVGMAERALEISREYVSQRTMFGKPLAKYEGISFEIAEDHGKLEQIKLYLQYAAWAADMTYKEPDFMTPRQLSRIVSICKMDAPILAADIARHTMMHHGAFGFTKDCPIERGLRGVMSYVVGAEGGHNIQKLIIAREYIGDVAVPYR